MTRQFSRRDFVAGAAAVAATATAAPKAAARRGALPVLPTPAAVPDAHPADLELVDAVGLLRAGRLSSRELTDACLERIERRDGVIGAWVRVYPDIARSLATAADARLRRERERAPLLCGVPVGLKDLYAVEGCELTASSRVLEGNVARGDATVWRRLRGQGMVLLGHTHTDEFAFGVATPQTANPWDASRSPGGSSGGSGAALAARMVPAALGTDTGGSVRSPASACGVSALKPSAGRVSTYGVIPLVWGRDSAGPMARSLRDVSLLLGGMQGLDPNDPATLAAPPMELPAAPRAGSRPLAGVRIGLARDAGGDLPAGLAGPWADFLRDLQTLGAVLTEYEVPAGPRDPTAADRPETGVYHRQFVPARLHRYRPDLVPLIADVVAESNVPAFDYIEHQRWRADYAARWAAVFRAVDFVVKPGAIVDGPTHAKLAGITVFSGHVTGDYRWANHAGLPALLTPVGPSTSTGLPFGAQIGGPPHSDGRLLQVGIDYQARFPHHARMPPSRGQTPQQSW